MRKATLKDVKKIQQLINNFAKAGSMLPRSLNEIYENIRDYWVVEEEEKIAACCALHPAWEDIAEIKSLAVNENFQKKNIGKELVKACLQEAISLDVTKVFALTYVPEFFEKIGFEKAEKDSMPHKIWSECIKCPHFPDCDEVLVVKEL